MQLPQHIASGKATASVCLLLVLYLFAPQKVAANNVTLFRTVYNTDAYVAGGGGMHSAAGGRGTITVGGLVGPVTAAYLYWNGQSNNTDGTFGSQFVFNDVTMAGLNLGPSFDNGWGFLQSRSYRADVTALVAPNPNRTHTIQFLHTNIFDPDGASLVIFYNDPNPENNRDIWLFNGNDSNTQNIYDANGWNVSMPGIRYRNGTPILQLHIADGQTYPDPAMFMNGNLYVPAGGIFQGNTVPSANNGPLNNGNLWDIRNFGLNLTPGINNLSLTTSFPGGTEDALSVVAAIVYVPASARSPVGALDNVDADGNVGGWAVDPDASAQAINVNFYIDGPVGTGSFIGTATADLPRAGTNYQGNHGFTFSIPDTWRDGQPHTLYAYGVDATGDANGLLTDAPRSFTLYSPILSVAIEPLQSALDANPNASGGQRIFPDKQSPTDTVNRRLVRVSAELPEERPNIRIYFRAFDVDDPSSNITPIDPNGNAGNDNRGMPLAGTLSSASALTDFSGVARVDFTTTMQPGDNFVIAASMNPTYLNGITSNGIELVDASGNVITGSLPRRPATAKRTQMLTVWRNLHIERDSMGRVTGNELAGQIASHRVGPTAILYPNQPMEIDRFRGGRVVIDGVGDFTVDSNTVSTLTLRNATVNLRPFAQFAFTLYDDDNFDGGSGPLNGDHGEDLPAPDIGRLNQSDIETANAFAPAYVRPIYDVGDNNNNVPFVLNTQSETGAGIRSTFDFDAIGTEADVEFWTVYLLNSYQCVNEGDLDPYTESSTNFVASAVSDAINGQGSTIFLEIFSEFELSVLFNPANTAAHEMGHLFNGDHMDGGLMADISSPDRTNSFSDISINRIRSINHP